MNPTQLEFATTRVGPINVGKPTHSPSLWTYGIGWTFRVDFNGAAISSENIKSWLSLHWTNKIVLGETTVDAILCYEEVGACEVVTLPAGYTRELSGWCHYVSDELTKQINVSFADNNPILSVHLTEYEHIGITPRHGQYNKPSISV